MRKRFNKEKKFASPFEAAAFSDDRATLARLSKDDELDIRTEVAGNSNTPPDILDELSYDVSEVRYWLASNLKLKESTLLRLATDNEASVLVAVVRNPVSSLRVLYTAYCSYPELIRANLERALEPWPEEKLRSEAAALWGETMLTLPKSWILRVIYNQQVEYLSVDGEGTDNVG